ncbi:MAG: M1 family aminopeptidase [Ginsengibacter sp.]
MKIIIFTLLQLFSVSYAQKIPSQFSTERIAELEKQAYIKTNFRKSPSSASTNFDVKYYRCEWEVDPSILFIKGKVTSYFVLTTQTSSISYDLLNVLHVDSVKSKNAGLSYSQTNNTVTINLGSSKASGTMDSISIYYQGIPPDNGFGSFEISTHANTPILWTLSEPYGSRDWWPCKNGLDDKADSIDVYITAPSLYKAASNGLLQNEIINGNKKTTHWKHRYPIASYLVCMAVTNYVEYKDYIQIGNHNLLMQTFCYPENLALFQQQTRLMFPTMKYFSELFGTYPFINEKYGHVQFGWGGGMEHQTSTFIYRPDEFLMSHELAHQWFGDKITIGSWQHIWLSEGFATFLTNLDAEKKYPQTAMQGRMQEINKITARSGGSVFVKDTTSVDKIFDSRLSYSKGGYLLYMLRWILGDSTFFKGVNNYFNDPALAYGFAITKDLQRHLEEVSGKKLDYFFDQWFYGEGYPSYKVEWTQIGDNFARIKMNQTTSDPSVPFFTLPVALQFKNAMQEKTIIVDNKTNGEIFFKEIGFIADTVIIDPDHWLITKNNSSQKIPDISELNQVQIYPNPFVNKVNINFLHFTSSKVYLKIFDANGRLVINETTAVNGYLFKEINLNHLPKGVYIVKVDTDDGVKLTRRIVRF